MKIYSDNYGTSRREKIRVMQRSHEEKMRGVQTSREKCKKADTQTARQTNRQADRQGEEQVHT